MPRAPARAAYVPSRGRQRAPLGIFLPDTTPHPDSDGEVQGHSAFAEMPGRPKMQTRDLAFPAAIQHNSIESPEPLRWFLPKCRADDLTIRRSGHSLRDAVRQAPPGALDG